MRLKNNNPTAVKFITLCVLCLSLFSFSSKMGGDSFEIYLNSKRILQQFVSHSSTVTSFQLDQRNSNEQMDVYYRHCGQVGTDRDIQVKDAQNHLLKEWHFADVTDSRAPMSFKVNDILNLQKKNNPGKVNLYYSSKQLPGGRLLASIILTNDKSNPVTISRNNSQLSSR